jgi:hypothetical protein
MPRAAAAPYRGISETEGELVLKKRAISITGIPWRSCVMEATAFRTAERDSPLPPSVPILEIHECR